jgi:hypothetical protein
MSKTEMRKLKQGTFGAVKSDDRLTKQLRFLPDWCFIDPYILHEISKTEVRKFKQGFLVL